MESLSSLQAELREAERELERITIRKYGDVPWAPGVQDSFHSESYSYDTYTDAGKAARLKSKIANLKSQIDTYPERARAEREREEELRQSRIPKYDYVVAGKKETTTNPALAARYDAQHRFFGASKVQQTLYRVTGQYRKFDKLWNKVGTTNKTTQQEIADELNKLFR